MEKLILATGNKHKAGEIQLLLSGFFEVVPFDQVDPSITWIEDGETFEENARIKSRAIVSKIKYCWVMSDDSGICVDALGGAPGVYSARYGGPDATDEINNEKLLTDLGDTPSNLRSARYVCCLSLISPAGDEHLFSGTLEGHIALHLSGSAGFGYDSLFIPAGFDQTVGVLGNEIKNSISHRSVAIEKLKQFVAKVLR